jgi:hypothetical protein
MAKRIVKWTLDGTILKLSKAIEDAVVEAEFDIIKLFPSFLEMTDVQKQLTTFGIRQKLMDTGASAVGESETKIQAAKTKWEELLAGKWTGERVNSTGAAENKRIAAEVKEAAKVVSLQGLMMKKIAFPTTFTEEDEAKLQEFLKRMAE